MLWQRTLREGFTLAGIGVHTGQTIELGAFPAPPDHGISFSRSDGLARADVLATVGNVVDTTLATTLGAGVNGSRVRVATVEHLMAAFLGLGIDNVRVHLDGPEVPVLDGSARPFVDALRRAGVAEQPRPKRFLVVTREVSVVDGDKVARITPGDGLQITCQIDFDHPLIPPTPFVFRFSERGFRQDIAPARTFGFLKDVEALRQRGLALGGSLDNAIVIDQYRVLNEEGLRYPDEFVRHKVLDALGDLALLGMPVIGKIDLVRPGHALNAELVRAVLADRSCYRIVEARAADAIARAPAYLFEPAESVA